MEARNEKGSVKYHIPNFSDSMELLGMSGIGTDEHVKLSGDKSVNMSFLLMGKVSRGIHLVIDEINIPEINSASDLLNDPDCSEIVSKITNDVVDHILSFLYVNSKKKNLKKQQDSGQAEQTTPF